jgi:hypothetical protein
MTENSRGLIAVESLNGSSAKSPKQPRGITYVEAGFSDIFGYDRAGPDDRAVADPDWEDGSVCPDAHAIAKSGVAPEPPFLCRAAGNEGIIDKHRPMRNEAIVPDGDQLTDEGVRLNTAALAYPNRFLYFDERTDKAAISNRATIDIHWLDDDDVLTKLNIDNPSTPDFRLRQGGLPDGPRLAGALAQRLTLS